MCSAGRMLLVSSLAAVLLIGGQVGAEERSYALEPLGDALPPDPEAANYILPRLANKYASLNEAGRWQNVVDPKLYLLTESEQQDIGVGEGARAGAGAGMMGGRRLKRTNGPSLSIVNPLDVLRQRLLLEIARRRMRQSEDQVIANREWLKTIGKRSIDQQSLREMEKSSDLDHGNHGRVGHS